MPVFVFVMMYVMHILPFTSDGPIWNAKIAVEVENCQNNWWRDVLLINNFVNADKQVNLYLFVFLNLSKRPIIVSFL